MTTSQASHRKNLSMTIRWVGTILSTGLFIWLISRQNWSTVLAKAAGIPLWAILLAVVFYIFSYAFNSLRWCYLLWAQQVKITFWQAFRMAWAGSFASNFLPSTIGGDGLRMAGIFRYTDRKTIAIGSVALDRIINMAAMACLLPAPVLIFGSALGKLFSGAALVTPLEWLQQQFRTYFPKIVTAFRVWSSQPWALVRAFLAAWPSNLFPMTATYLIAHQLGLNISFWQIIGVQTVTYFVTLLPSVNGYGLREVTYTTLYTALGASIEQASTLALITRFIMVLSTAPGAFWVSGLVPDVAVKDDELPDTETE